MRHSSILLLFLLGLNLVSAIIIGGEDDSSGGGRRGKKPRFDLSLSSGSDSDSSEHHHHGHRPRPPRGHRRTTPRVRLCPSDWMTFDRPQGRWCVKVFVGQYNQPAAEAQCTSYGATLTGLQTNDERLQLVAAGHRISVANGFADSAIWLGAHRKATCPSAGVCQPKDTFYWTDRHTTGTDGFVYARGQPDGVWANGLGAQDCLHLFVFPDGRTHPRWPGIIHGQIDDLHCAEGNVNPNRKMYACGKKAT